MSLNFVLFCVAINVLFKMYPCGAHYDVMFMSIREIKIHTYYITYDLSGNHIKEIQGNDA